MHVKLDGDTIEAVHFEGQGCAISKASTSVMTEAVQGKTIEEASELFETFRHLVKGEEGADPLEMGDMAVFEGVKRFPTRVKCAVLGWHTLQAALQDQDQPVTTE